MADRCRAGGEIGEDGGACPVAQPVQGGPRGGRRHDGVVDRDERRGDAACVCAEQFAGPSAQCAGAAPPALVEPVLPAAVRAGMAGGEPGAVGAGSRAGAKRMDEPALRVAAVAVAAAGQGPCVAGTADGALGPVRRRQGQLTAVRARGNRSRGACGADRRGGRGEAAGRVRPQPEQVACGRVKQPTQMSG